MLIKEKGIIRWWPPTQGWVKINCDGACLGNTLKATSGSLIRDISKQLLGDWFCKKAWGCNALAVEMWCFGRIKTHMKIGFYLRFDSMVFVNLIENMLEVRPAHRLSSL